MCKYLWLLVVYLEVKKEAILASRRICPARTLRRSQTTMALEYATIEPTRLCE